MICHVFGLQNYRPLHTISGIEHKEVTRQIPHAETLQIKRIPQQLSQRFFQKIEFPSSDLLYIPTELSLKDVFLEQNNV